MTSDKAVRRLTTAAVLTVAAVAALVSFVHIRDVAAAHGQTALAAFLLPFSIDGTIIASSLAMLRAARRGLDTPKMGRFMLFLAVLATLAANVAYGLPYGLVGAAISGWPAVAFIGCAEMAIGMVRRTHATVPAEDTPVSVPAAALVAPVSSAPAAAAPGPRPIPNRPRGRSRATVTEQDAERVFAAELAAGQVPSVRAVKARMHVGHPRAQALRDHLETAARERVAA